MEVLLVRSMVTISSALSASSDVSISLTTGFGSRGSGRLAAGAADFRDALRWVGRFGPLPAKAVNVGTLDLGIWRSFGLGYGTYAAEHSSPWLLPRAIAGRAGH